MKRMTALLLLLCLLCGLAGCYVDSEQKETSVHITFAVTHADGTEKIFEIDTVQKTLAAALLKEKLVEESAESAGMYTVVDGEEADWNDGEAWWCFSQNGEALTVGIEQVELTEDAHFEAVFTRGFGDTGA